MFGPNINWVNTNKTTIYKQTQTKRNDISFNSIFISKIKYKIQVCNLFTSSNKNIACLLCYTLTSIKLRPRICDGI